MMVLFPVILAVPVEKQQLKGREKVRFLSRHARCAAEWSAARAGIPAPIFAKDDRGAPRSTSGTCWSVSHKPEYVAGVVSRNRIGIDIEKIRPYSPGLEKKVASQNEWTLFAMNRSELLFRFWTAKEAVLKTMGVGLAGLSACTIQESPIQGIMTVRFNNQVFHIEHFEFDRHIAAVATDRETRIEWTVNACPPDSTGPFALCDPSA